MRPKRLAIGQQHVESAMRGNLRRQLAQSAGEFLHGRHAGMRLGQLLHQPAKGALAVGIAHRVKMAVQARRVVLEIAIVGKHPVTPPQLTHEGVAVLQPHIAHGGLANVGNDVPTFNGVAPDQLSHGRRAGCAAVNEKARAPPLKKGNAPAIGMMVGAPAALRKAGEAEGDIGRGIAIHAEQLAHGGCLSGFLVLECAMAQMRNAILCQRHIFLQEKLAS